MPGTVVGKHEAGFRIKAMPGRRIGNCIGEAGQFVYDEGGGGTPKGYSKQRCEMFDLCH